MTSIDSTYEHKKRRTLNKLPPTSLASDACPSSLFCVHGGLSPRLRTVEDIRSLERRVEPEEGTLLADLLWSDPSDDPSVVRWARRVCALSEKNAVSHRRPSLCVVHYVCLL